MAPAGVVISTANLLKNVTRAARAVLRDALSLSDDDRAILAELLLESLQRDAEDRSEESWLTEIDRRISELHSGAVEPIGWDDVRLRLLTTIRDSSAGSLSSGSGH